MIGQEGEEKISEATQPEHLKKHLSTNASAVILGNFLAE